MGTATTVEAQILDPSTVKPVSKIRIIGNVYGGGDQAAVQGNTTVEINKGQFGGDIFGGGNGAIETDGEGNAIVKTSADVGMHNEDGTLKEGTGNVHVTINGGEVFYAAEDHLSNHNIYGGGNMACNVAGDTYVEMNKGIVTNWTFYSNINIVLPEWYKWYDQAMNPNTQKTPIVAVFGAGYGAHTDVAGDTHVKVDFESTEEINPANGEFFTHAELEEIDKIIMRWMPDHRLVEQFVSAVHGGGYDGTVGAYDIATKGINYDKTSYTSQTNITIQGQPFIFDVYGGGLGSKNGADANGSVNSHVGAVYGATKVDIQGGIINGDVFGGGAGIAGQATIPNPFPGAMGGETVNLPYTYAGQVMRETDVTIDGKSTVIFGNVYGGGDIANTGWHTTGARPTMEGHVGQQNTSLARLDYTTSLNLNGGNILGKVFGGGNGRKKADVEQYKFIGSVIGSTNVTVNGSHIWGDIYGGGNTGCVYSCQTIAGTQGKTGREMATIEGTTIIDGSTNVSILDGTVARDIFGGGYGDDPSGWEADVSSADISGNTFVFFKEADLEYEKYWKPREVATAETMGSPGVDEPTGHFLYQKSGYDEVEGIDYRNSESDISHNLYGGGNMACTVQGNTHVYMSGAPTAPADFNTTEYYKVCIANVAKPHFSVFGGGFGAFAKVANNAYSDINLAKGTGLHSVIGGGMNGPVAGSCQVHVGNDPMSLVHHVYGGGYYAPCHDTELEITRGTILENVFGGSVMGNIMAENTDLTMAATKTTIGLQTPGDGRHSSIDLEDEHGRILRQYTYTDHKNQITIGGNVYGANDVSGTVNGVASLTIYGGTIKGDVFGAGNGDHIGYYVPDELRYDLGAHGTDNYFTVIHHELGAPNGNTYVGRPQTIGGVELTLEGNKTDERVTVLGQVFGGGNSCTVGSWNKELLSTTYFSNPHLTRDDPQYFLGGGKIDINLGSHVTIGRTHAQLEASADKANYLVDVDGRLENVSGLYMGCSGRHLATQDWSKTENYYHHYYDASTAQYWPGFAVYHDASNELLSRHEGLQSFLAYMNNILVWSDDVKLNIKNQDNTAAEDIWLSNFVGGGFRGSMKAKTPAGQFHYTLPRGVTIGHDIIGGAFNTDVVYRIFETEADGHTYTEEAGHYKYLTDVGSMTKADEGNTTGDYHHIEYAANGTDITGIVRFYYDGGMLSELDYGTPKASNDRINRILKKYSAAIDLPVERDVNKDFTGTGLNDPKAFNYYKRDALVYLELDNKIEVEYVDGHVHGGNVFGGCFSSGRVEGDIWTDYRCFQEGQQANSNDFNLSDQNFSNAKDFENNFAMMLFGAGYGANTNIQGSAYVRVLHQEVNPNSPIPGMAYGYPRLYNVFGGSFEGKVEGNTNIYFNPGKYGYVAGAIYGGGCNGYVGGKTYLELAGGYIDEAYGGARNANIGGGTHIWTYDGSDRWWGEDVVHASGAAMTQGDAEKAPLFIGKLYGGTDISGKICTDEAGTYTKEHGYQPYYTARHWPEELTTNGTYDPSHPGDNLTYIDTYLQVGGIVQSNHGFPIIGEIFAAGNGENTKNFFEAKYAQTKKSEDQYNDDKLPVQHSTLMEISDGNIVYAFGGGNNATVSDQNYILVRSYLDSKHDIEGLGGRMYDVMKKRILSVGVDCYDEKIVDGQNVLSLKNASIQRLFGGNNVATMAIQPKWSLQEGRINNVYSGGNMGDMTYYNPSGYPATEDKSLTGKSGAIATDGSNSNYTPRGLSITIDHPDIHIGSLYGGCRLSDVVPGGYAADGKTPLMKDEFAKSEDYYGATVNITDGYIENVYGGNDISGTVYFGTNVNISGAVSGNVYGSGNGFYLYKWDKDATEITEHLLKEYDPEASDKALCYTVPANAAFGGKSANDTRKLLTINAARPSVEKAFLNIAGLEHYPTGVGNPKRVAYVKGNVFCGGNASTIIGSDEDKSFSKFKIGSYVTLNGVFMGSDGYAYTQNDQIAQFAKLNGFTNMGAATDPSAFPDFKDGASVDQSHNPILLNVYMMAVDMKSQPKDFNLNLPLKEAHIGTYCGGGNRGSMLVDKTVSLPFHHDIIIYDKIVAACLDANVKYNQGGKIITSWGGYTRAIDIAHNGDNGNTKMKLDIASQFVPLVMDVPADKLPDTKNEHGETFAQAVAHDFLYRNQTEGEKYTYEEFNKLFEAHWESQEQFEHDAPPNIQWKVAPNLYADKCNIYGGCFESGEVEGDIILNLHTNMLRYVNKENLDKTIAENIPCFNVYGAGFGQDSHVWGNVTINVDRSLDKSTMGEIGGTTLSPELQTILSETGSWDIQNQEYNSGTHALDCSYPSFNSVFGGGRNGKLIGNATVELRNGLVYTDVAGGCYASDLYGSTQVIVGYPKYYKCNTSGEYALQRGDTWNTDKLDVYGDQVVKQSVRYLKGDLVPNNVYQQIVAHTPGNASYFVKESVTPQTNHATDGTTWADIHIKVGKGIYGGGYSLANSTAASAGSITTHKLSSSDDKKLADRKVDFDGRYGLEAGLKTEGYAGNSSIMVGDEQVASYTGTERDHISISTLIAKPVTVKTGSTMGKFKLEGGKYTHQGEGTFGEGDYFDLTGEGGVYGDGHLTFCEGFRTADITRYGYAEGTPQHPVLLNTFQRMDLLSINDCCLMLQGAQDFATDQIDATTYSITRVNEMRLNSSLDAAEELGEISSQTNVGGAGNDFDHKQQRNYLAFFNNVHYLGSIVTNDAFTDGFHNEKGIKESGTYIVKKQSFIDAYTSSAKDATATETFKQRNVATARNAIGINNGYCLRVQNQNYEGGNSKTYYGPIVGVCEIKLLTLTQGEGGGYVYADNIHEVYAGHGKEEYFLMTSGNFVFPGVVNADPALGNQFIVDDCYLTHFGTTDNITTKAHSPLDEAHYWYVEGNKYYFNTTLTGFTFNGPLSFDLTDNDPNIVLSGMQKDSKLNVNKIEWLSTETGFHRKDYEAVLPNKNQPDYTDDYEFDIQVGGYGETDWKYDMIRWNDATGSTDKAIVNDNLPQFNIHLIDSKDNSGDAKYINHLDEPELVKIYLVGETDGKTYEYTITLNIVYLQGPTFEGGVKIENCALPGEWIGFSSDGLKIKTPELMPITAASWQIVPLKQITDKGVWEWDIEKGTVIPKSSYSENTGGNVSGTIRALYKQNEYNIAYIFTAGGKNFPVMPAQADEVAKENRMIVVHNYHRMKDVVPQDLQIEKMPVVPNNSTGDDVVIHPQPAEAKLYIEDEADLRAFIEYLNMAKASYTDADGTHEGNAMKIPVGLEGLDIILQKDITLTSALPVIKVPFAGTFHGDGHHIDLGEFGTTLFGNKLALVKDADERIVSQGKVYNLGLKGGSISTLDNKADNGLVNGTYTCNSYEYTAGDDFQYGRNAYLLSHTFTPSTEGGEAIVDEEGNEDPTKGYVYNYYANGDYQYATSDRVWSLRTGAPNYGSADSRHNQAHTPDAARWDEVKAVNVPLYDGTVPVTDRTETVSGDLFTYKGLPVGYANDYLFFGQHLDREYADAYPMHINQVATGDADKTKGGNRVYETAGYYRSSSDQKFYYNADAWALKPTLTAIDFTQATIEGDGASTVPTNFDVDSNLDYGTSVESDYDNAQYRHVTQNLLVYNGGQDVFGYKDVNDSKESSVLYHNITNTDEGFKTDYFHLVDKQDFWAPIAFNVNDRAWYERKPQSYRNVDEGYGAGSAWEGIVLPFTAKKVSAEKNGEISHFYGDSVLHHEYWLRGFKGVETKESKTYATFARPAVSGETCFLEDNQTDAKYDYTYPKNDYFTSLYNYNDWYDTRDDEDDDTMGNHAKAWYAQSHTFADYVPLTAEVPYIIAFPGDDFYEFSMESVYNDKNAGSYGSHTYRQMATFECGETRIGVTDETQIKTSVGTVTHRGTFLHVEAQLGINDKGTAFVDNSPIVPFRTYMTVSNSSPAPTRAIMIWGEEWSEQIGEEPEEPEDELGEEYLKIWAEGTDIIIETSSSRTLGLYRSDGVRMDVLHCSSGLNRFAQESGGFYFVGKKKLLLR